MRPFARLLLIAATLLSPAWLHAQTATGPGPAGHWEGTIKMEQDLRVTVDLARNPAGAWIGSLSVPGTTTTDMPLTGLVVEGTRVRFSAAVPMPASFDATLSSDAQRLSRTASSALGSTTFQTTRKGAANVSVPIRSSPWSKEFEGAWEGALDAGGKALRIGLKLSHGADGIATATLISIDQGAQEIPITTVTIKDTQLQVESRAVSGTYKGMLGANGEIAGEWSQGGVSVRLSFKRAPDAK